MRTGVGPGPDDASQTPTTGATPGTQVPVSPAPSGDTGYGLGGLLVLFAMIGVVVLIGLSARRSLQRLQANEQLGRES